MNKQKILENLKELKAYLERSLNALEKSSYLKVEGSLIIRNVHGKVRFYRRGRDSSLKYLGKDKMKVVTSLAGKRYVCRLILEARKELRQVDRCLRILGEANSDMDEVRDGLPEPLKAIVGPAGGTSQDYVNSWLRNMRSARNMKVALNSPYRTQGGETVKSKSEVIIADRLRAAGVPYVYEVSLEFERDIAWANPDFTVLNRRTLKEYYWEHCGMMDDVKYITEFSRKLALYARNGIFPGRNLLLSFEGGGNPLSTEYVDKLIREYLL